MLFIGFVPLLFYGEFKGYFLLKSWSLRTSCCISHLTVLCLHPLLVECGLWEVGCVEIIAWQLLDVSFNA